MAGREYLVYFLVTETKDYGWDYLLSEVKYTLGQNYTKLLFQLISIMIKPGSCFVTHTNNQTVRYMIKYLRHDEYFFMLTPLPWRVFEIQRKTWHYAGSSQDLAIGLLDADLRSVDAILAALQG